MSNSSWVRDDYILLLLYLLFASLRSCRGILSMSYLSNILEKNAQILEVQIGIPKSIQSTYHLWFSSLPMFLDRFW